MDEKRKEAVNALIRIAVLEAAIIAVAVAAYIATGKLSYVIGGVVGAQIIVAPLFIRWAREQAGAQKPPTGTSA